MMSERGRKLLVIDDSLSVRQRVLEFMREHDCFDEYLTAADGVTGLRLLLENHELIDLVLCDLEMPELNGFGFLAARGAASVPLERIPVIMLTARAEAQNKIEGLRRGASDYLTKPFDSGELLARVQVQLKLKNAQEQLRQQNVELERLCRVDALTGVSNRRHLMEQLDLELSRAQRYGIIVSLIMLDIDHFKDVNDTYGHQAGDEVLSVLGQFLMGELRRCDTIGRYGGEEFAIIMPHTNAEQARLVAERLRQRLAVATSSCGCGGVTASLGVSSNQHLGAADPYGLVRTADAALYEAKAGGRNRVVVSPQGLRSVDSNITPKRHSDGPSVGRSPVGFRSA